MNNYQLAADDYRLDLRGIERDSRYYFSLWFGGDDGRLKKENAIGCICVFPPRKAGQIIVTLPFEHSDVIIRVLFF